MCQPQAWKNNVAGASIHRIYYDWTIQKHGGRGQEYKKLNNAWGEEGMRIYDIKNCKA